MYCPPCDENNGMNSRVNVVLVFNVCEMSDCKGFLLSSVQEAVIEAPSARPSITDTVQIRV